MPAPKTLRPAPNLANDTIESWRQEPAHPGWAGGLRETWQPSDISALKTRAQAYAKVRAR
jgi:deoxyribodipyrimidine photo-lyase